MKTSFKIVLLVITLVISMTSNAQSFKGKGDQVLIAKAICAAQAAGCFAGNANDYIIYGQVETVSICFYTGAVRIVKLYAYHWCPQWYFCAQSIRLVATVEFDCDETADMVTCEP